MEKEEKNVKKKTFPSFEEYKKLGREYEIVPVWKTTGISDTDPTALFERMAPTENAFILESVEKGGQTGRYSFIGVEIEGLLKFSEKDIEGGGGPMKALRGYLGERRAPAIEGLPPFYGGAVGYASYDLIKYIENVPSSGEDDLKMPVYVYMLAKNVIVFDHAENCVKVVVNSTPGDSPGEAYKSAARKIEEIEEGLSGSAAAGEGGVHGPETEIASNFGKADFCSAVGKAKRYIEEGDIFQVVLSQRLKTSLSSPPFLIYRTLRKINPSPYMFYLKTGEDYLIGSSPETHVKVIGDKVTIRPIAGTRKRGENREEDEFLEKDLLSDEKERAEHLMLVDLARNDLGRVAEAGTVEVDDFMKVFRYSHVMHIESNVTGKMREGKDRFDVFEYSFPAGTVSGAPKIRAMEIIDELEPTIRGPYAGAVGYFSFSGNMDTCITIRTILVRGKEVYVQAGAGIVADSEPENEYNETLNKAKALLKALSESRIAYGENKDAPADR